MKIVKEKLNITLITNDIDCCYRLKENLAEHPPIIIKICRRTTRNTTYPSKSKLKGSKIHIREDLTYQRASMVKDLAKHIGYSNIFTNQGNVFAKISGKISRVPCINHFCNITSGLRWQWVNLSLYSLFLLALVFPVVLRACTNFLNIWFEYIYIFVLRYLPYLLLLQILMYLVHV